MNGRWNAGGAWAMIHGARTMKGFVFVSETATVTGKILRIGSGFVMPLTTLPAAGKRQRHRKK